jgi:hypothetical protein
VQKQNNEDEGSGSGADDIQDAFQQVDEPGNILDQCIGCDEFEEIILKEGNVNLC